jgi:EmrB/QacA subfamily drug resistance transporter
MDTDQRLAPDVLKTAFAVLAGGMAVIFDTTIVSVALNSLATDLHTSVDVIQWVSTGYLLALFVTIPIAGWAQNRIGGKRLWLLALSVFGVGSVLCSLAWNPASLITFRILQGIGGGVMLPLMSTLIMQAAGGKNLGRLMSMVSLPAVLGPILGPVLGGVILNYLDWRWLFWVNVPFCILGFVLAVRMLPADEPSDAGRFDIVGLLLISPGVVAVLYGLSKVNQDGGFGRSDVLLPVLVGLALIAGFAGWALRARGRALIDVRLFRHRPVSSASMLLFLSGASLYGSMLLLPLYWQQVRGTDALGAGLLLIPQGVGTLCSRSLAGRLTDQFGARWVAVVGFAIVAAATVPFALAVPQTSEILLMAALFVRGFGLGAVTVPVMTVAYVGLERTQVPHASILTRIAQQLGGSFGVAILAVILSRAASGADSVAGRADAFSESFWWAVGFTALAVPLSLLLPVRSVATTPVTEPTAPAEPAVR